MLNKISFRNNLIVFTIPFLMILSMYLLTKSPWFANYPKEISIGITLDLIFTIPFIYFLIIRKKEIPKITIVSLFVFGLVIASYILPQNQQTLLLQVKTYIFPIVEFGILSFLFIKVRKTVKEFKKLETNNLDFFDAINIACKESFSKKIATLLATEIAVIYYVFFLWKKRITKQDEFTNYKENGLISLLLALLLVVFIETFAIHKFAEKWCVLFAWGLTITSIYSGFQLLALVKSLVNRPFVVDIINEQIILRFGFFGKAIIPFMLVEELLITFKDLPEDKSVVYFSPLGSLGGHNVIVHLKKEVDFESFYGFKKRAKSLAIFVDDKNRFVEFVESNLKASQK